jgi:hypothetical protein
MRTCSKPESTSNFVTNSSVSPFTRDAYRRSATSSHPQRRFRPVTVPNSWPRTPRRSPSSPRSSVGNGPAPTRVMYAFTIPTTRSTSFGPNPADASAYPATGFEDVTNG